MTATLPGSTAPLTPSTISPTEMTGETVLARVRDLLPGIAERIADGEEQRQLPTASAKAFLDAGLARILMPRSFGGYELGLDVWFAAVEAIGEVDAAQAWCASLIVHHPHYLSQFPLAAQEAVWANGPDVAIATSLAPVTKVEAVEGGYRLTGEAAWTSGIGHSSWAMIGGMLPVAGPPRPALFLVPAASFTVRDVWQTTGMRGTGSNTIVTDGAFVPETHLVAMSDLMAGTGPGAEIHQGAIYRAPLVSYSPLTFVVPMLGAGKGALAQFLAWATPRQARKNASVNNMTTLIRTGRVAADLDAAELLMRRGMALAQEPERPSIELRARCLRDWARASELIVGAVNELLALSGTAGFSLSSALQKHWRDVNFAARHVTLNPDSNYAYWTSVQVGLPRNPAEVTAF